MRGMFVFLFFSDCRTERESENTIQVSRSKDDMKFKAISIAFASAENIDVRSGKRSRDL